MSRSRARRPAQPAEDLNTPGVSTILAVVVSVGGSAGCDRSDPHVASSGGRVETLFTDASGRLDRVFAHAPDSLVALLGQPPNGLAYPLSTEVSATGDIYVLDFGNLLIRRFAPDGRFLRNYGAGSGEGPGEFQGLTDFDIDDNGQLWTWDPTLARFQVLNNLDGSVVRTIRRPWPSTRFALVPGEHIVMHGVDSLLFQRFAPDSSGVFRFGRVVNDQFTNAMVVEGEFVHDDSTVVYTGLYGGVLGRWSFVDGSVRYVRPTVVDRSFPTLVRRDGAIFIAPEDRVGAALGITLDGDEIAVLAYADTIRVLDIYELSDGSYRHSMVLPDQTARHVSIADGRYVLTGDTLVSIWTFSGSGR